MCLSLLIALPFQLINFVIYFWNSITRTFNFFNFFFFNVQIGTTYVYSQLKYQTDQLEIKEFSDEICNFLRHLPPRVMLSFNILFVYNNRTSVYFQ